MYRLLIADDEALEREGLEMMILRKMPNQFRIFHAENGREAIEIAEENRLDIVLMDIKMPGIDGLAALKKIAEIQPKVKMVLLTAYDYFHYAKEAITLGVKDYILKPADRDQVLGLLKRLVTEVETEKGKRQKELELQEKLSALLPIVETEMVLILTTSYVPEKDFQHLAELLGFEMDSGYSAVISFHQNWDGLAGDREALHEEVRAWLKRNISCLTGPMIGSQMTVFVSVAGDGDAYTHRLKSIQWSEELLRFITAKHGLHPQIGIGRMRKGLEGFRRSYQEAFFAMSSNDLPLGIRHYDDLQFASDWSGYSIEDERRLLEAVKGLDLSGALQTFGQMFEQLTDDCEGKIAACRRMLSSLFGTLHYQLGFMDASYLEKSRFNDAATLDELRISGEQHLRQLAEEILQDKGKKVSSVIEQAKAFIDQHFTEEISLEMTAEHVNLSPYYFSKMFKNESGENFSDYVTERRIAKSKELMTDVNVSLKEVCYLVGYKDPNYFSRVFKRVTGATPTEYRNQLFQ